MIKAGNLLEICERCRGCGTQHPCGQESCKHDYAFAVEDEKNGKVKARFFLLGDLEVNTRKIIASGWGGWVPEEIQMLYDEWMDQKYGEDADFDYE